MLMDSTRAQDAMQRVLIDVIDVKKSYVTNLVTTPVLHGVNFSMQRGEFVAIMGQSGSGKSTLMNILGCLDTPSDGEYRLDGKQVSALSRAQLAVLRNKTIGFVFQSFNLLKRMTIQDNVALPLIYAGVSRAEARRRASQQLENVGLGEYGQRQPNQLSGGQQQRVAIARALVADPPLVLADEPTGNLDTKTSVEIMSLLTRLNREAKQSIILVTHEPDVAAYASRLVRLKDGLVLYDGPAATGLQQMRTEQLEQELGMPASEVSE